MDRLLGAQDRTRVPEEKPAVKTKDGSMRGIQHEEFSDTEPLSTPSVLGPALAAEFESRREALAHLYTGGPDRTAMSEPKVVRPAVAKRTGLQIVNVAGESYRGAGTIDKNIRRAAKRQFQKDEKAGNESVEVKGVKVGKRKTKITLKGTKTRPEVRSEQPDGKPKVTPEAVSKIAPTLTTKLM